MSIIVNAERYMKRYDYLIKKRERKHNEGKRLSSEEDEELQKIRPNVVTPIFVMFELLYDVIKRNQEIRRGGGRVVTQKGGGGEGEGEWTMAKEREWEPPSTAKAASTSTSAASAAAATAAAAAAAAAAATAATSGSAVTNPPPQPSAPPLEDDDGNDNAADTEDADAKEAGRLIALEESLLPLLTKIIVYIEQNKKAEKKKDDEEEEVEKYPDIGTSAKNSAILVIRRIKKWWNDLIDLKSTRLNSSHIPLPRMQSSA